MDLEYSGKVHFEGKEIPVVVTYQIDGYKPILTGLWKLAKNGEDQGLLMEMFPRDIDRIYTEICFKVLTRDLNDYVTDD